MSSWRKFWMNKWVWYPCLVGGPLMFNAGMKLVGVLSGEPIGMIVGFIIGFIGLALIWIPFNCFKDEYERVKEDNDIYELDRRDRLREHNRPLRSHDRSASANAWVDDDDIDGDGIGGDSLTRMGITSRSN